MAVPGRSAGVTPDLVALTCPRCSAHLRPAAPWCTQCFLDLKPAPPPAPPPPVAGPAGTDGPADGPGQDERRWPCPACGAHTRLDEATCAGCGLGFLDALKGAEVPALALPVVGDLARLSTVQRTVLAVVVIVMVMLATFLFGVAFS